MACALKSLERQQRNQVSGVQAGGGGVEAGIESQLTGSRRRAQRVQVGGLGDQSAPGQFVDDVAAHARTSPALGAGVREARRHMVRSLRSLTLPHLSAPVLVAGARLTGHR
jgi:hypothetical protein